MGPTHYFLNKEDLNIVINKYGESISKQYEINFIKPELDNSKSSSGYIFKNLHHESQIGIIPPKPIPFVNEDNLIIVEANSMQEAANIFENALINDYAIRSKINWFKLLKN